MGFRVFKGSFRDSADSAPASTPIFCPRSPIPVVSQAPGYCGFRINCGGEGSQSCLPSVIHPGDASSVLLSEYDMHAIDLLVLTKDSCEFTDHLHSYLVGYVHWALDALSMIPSVSVSCYDGREHVLSRAGL